jgi:hypothetical protein
MELEDTDVDRTAAATVVKTLEASARFTVGLRRRDVGSLGLQSLGSTAQRVDLAVALNDLAHTLTAVLVDDDARHLPEPDPQTFDPARIARLRGVGAVGTADLASWYSTMLDEE